MRSEAWRPAAAARTGCPGRCGKPPAGHYDPDARSSHRAGRKSGEGSAAPEPKIATVRAPRGGRPALWDARRLASAWPAALRAGPPGASQAPVRLSALRHPSIGGKRSESSKTRAQKTRRGNENGCFILKEEAKTNPKHLEPSGNKR